MVKIAFHDMSLSVRGSSVAIYDYAHYNETILLNSSIIVIPYSESKIDPIISQKFSSRFPLFFYKTRDELENILTRENCDILYCIKYGKNDGIKSEKIKTAIHCVFDMSEPHGDIYAGVSETLAKKFNRPLYVPHIISLEKSKKGENWRQALGIPEEAVVFGRYGGVDTMDLTFCWRAIELILDTNKNIYFLFSNTPQMILHPNIKYMPKVITDEEKNRFIHTCDAYIECGRIGHTFGITIGEFSINNKPIIAYKGYPIVFRHSHGNVKINGNIWTGAHIDILSDKGIYYKDEREFYNIMNEFKKEDYKNKDLNAYKEYTPERVMKQFHSVFISNFS